MHRHKSTMHRPPHALVAALAALTAVLALLISASAAVAADRNFSLRFSANDTGNITMAANTLMTCADSAACTTARNGPSSNTAPNGGLTNNAYLMQWVDGDGDNSTFNSSSAELSLPGGSTVLFAGLYWGGDLRGSGANAAPDASASNRALFKAPGDTAYRPQTASTLDASSTQTGRYQGFVEVTDIVRDAGAGNYTVANVQSGKGADRYAGWSLIVAYRNTSQPARNLSVFDGLISVFANQAPTNIPVSGFQTPPAGDVKTSVGFVTYEGDLGFTGDTASLDGTRLGDAQSPTTNFFNSSISRNGDRSSDKTPDYVNQLGFDADITNADGYLGNDQTSATITVTTSGDAYLPGVVTFATELYAPRIEQEKTAVDLNGGQLVAGDVIEYRITGENVGQDDAVSFVLRDAIPANTTYVPGSLNVVAGLPAGQLGAKSDDVDSDQAELDASGDGVTFRLGEGADDEFGGRIRAGTGYEARFRVTVGEGLPAGTVIDNRAIANFNSRSLNTPLSADARATSTVAAPDLAIEKTRTSGPIVPGEVATWRIDVDNVGDAPSVGTITAADTFGAEFEPIDGAGTGWTCDVSAQTLTCTTEAVVEAGEALPPLTVRARVDAGASGNLENTATVEGGGDTDPSNNSSTSGGPANPRADLEIEKSADPSTILVGETTTFTLTVRNNGPSAAQAVAVEDLMTPGLEPVSASASQGTCNAALVCSLGTLGAGQTATITIAARARPSSAGSAQRNVARVESATTDPNETNNQDDADVAVGAVDLAITKTVEPETPYPGGPISYTVTVESEGPSPASGVLIRDRLPAEIDGAMVTVVEGTASCDLTGRELLCDGGALAAGERIVLLITGTVAPDTGRVRITNEASVSSEEPDSDPTDNSDSVDADVIGSADLAIAKSAPGRIDPGTEADYTVEVTNDGPAAALNAVVTDELPSGVTLAGPLPAGCSEAGGTITCELGNLDPGAELTLVFRIRVSSSAAGTITNTATVDSDTDDPDPDNNSSSTSSEVPGSADLEISKSVADSSIASGETTVFTLTVTNGGPSIARDTVISDPLPAGVEFVSSAPGAPVCEAVAGVVTCQAGDLAPGETTEVRITVRATEGEAGDGHRHHLPVTKAELQLDFDPGQTRVEEISCGPDQLISDGSVRVDAVDQGTGTHADLIVVAIESTDQNTYRAVVRNEAAGRVQAKLFATCIPARTVVEDGHDHGLILGTPSTATEELIPGRHEIEVACGPGQQPIAPSFTGSGGVTRIYASEPSSAGWRFGVEVEDDPSEVTVGVRCLERSLEVVDGHTHRLRLDHPERDVTIPAGQIATEEISCAEDEKGILATFDLGEGLIALGHDPRPKTRSFRIYNPTATDIDATIDVVCLGDRTGSAVVVGEVINSATVSSGTSDPDMSNNSASAGVSIAASGSGGGGGTGGGGTGGGSGAPGLANFAGGAAALKPRAIKLTVACPAGGADCAGTVVLRAPRGSGYTGSNRRLGSTSFTIAAGTSQRLKVAVRKSKVRKLRKGKVRRVQATIKDTGAGTVRRALKLRR